MKLNRKLIKQDIKSAVPVLGIVAVVIAISNIILGKICPFRIIFGIPCPGCGITRAFLLALQGKFHQATVMHFFWIPFAIIFVAFLMIRYVNFDDKLSKKLNKMIKRCFVILMIVFVIYYIYRMIIWFPNKEPMIYDANNIMRKLMKTIHLYLQLSCQFFYPVL